MLSRKADNRKFSPEWAAQLAQRMRDDEWRDTKELLHVNRDGQLINGQHRLTGVVDSGRTITFWIAYDSDDDAMLSIDNSRARTASDIATIMGYDYPRTRPSAMHILLRWEADPRTPFSERPHDKRPVRWSAEHLLTRMKNDFPDIHVGLDYAQRMGKAKPPIPGGYATWTALTVMLFRADAVAAEQFLDSLMAGSNLSDDSPIHALRNSLLTSSVQARKSDAREFIAALTIVAFNWFRQGKTAPRYKAGKTGSSATLRWRRDQSQFPLIWQRGQPMDDKPY